MGHRRRYFPKPEIILKTWSRPEVEAKKFAILKPENISKRSNPEEKLKNFMKEGDDLIRLVEHEASVAEQLASPRLLVRVGAWLAQKIQTWQDLLLVLSFLINILMVVDYVRNDATDDGKCQEQRSPECIDTELADVDMFLDYVGVLHLLMSILVFYSYGVKTGLLLVKAGFATNPENTLNLLSNPAIMSLWVFITFLYSMCRSTSKRFFGVLDSSALTIKLPTWTWSLIYFFSQTLSIYHALFVVVSFLGATTPKWAGGKLWFSLAIFDVVRLSPVMQKVIAVVRWIFAPRERVCVCVCEGG